VSGHPLGIDEARQRPGHEPGVRIGDVTDRQPPQITPEQRAAALAKAGEARRIRAEIKELLKTGSLTFREVLDRAESEEYIAGLKVESVLESLPGMGKIGAKRLLESLEIAPNRRLRGLGDRQRKALLAKLG
jgi:hypothetical protein